IPVTVMCGLAGPAVMARRSTAARAAQIGRGVVNLSELVKLHAAIEAQDASEAFAVRFAQLGVTPASVSVLLGFDVSTAIEPARAHAEEAILALGQSSPVQLTTFQALYAEIDTGRLDPAGAMERFRAAEDSTVGAIDRMVKDLQAQAQRTHADSLIAALGSLQAADGFVEIAAPQGVDLSAVWFPAPGGGPQATQAAVARLGAETADYASATKRVRDLAVPSVVASLAGIETDTRIQGFDQAVAAALRADPVNGQGRPIDASIAGVVFRGYLIRSSLINGLVVAATAAVRNGAEDLAASQRASFVAWAGLAAMLMLISVAVAVGVARSIAKPLGDLSDYAHAVNEGNLDADSSRGARRGPRETRLAFAVFTDLVANLRLLDAKANALATCAFDAPVLRQPLPGRLGRSLETSVAVLSGSIVERDRLQTHLAHQATHDALTGLANRAAAIVAIQEAIHRASRSGQMMALLFIDLNEFKWVNDHHGHELGDEVLKHVAARLLACVRAGDLVARLGGDEFVVFSERVAGVDEAVALAHRVLATVGETIDLGRVSVTVGASIGVAMTLDGPEEPLRLLARADAAMSRAKRNDRSSVEIYDAVLQAQLVEREDVERALGDALADPSGGGLLLQYQPVVQADSGAIVGVEALVRWDRPDHGRLQPDAFIPIAEASSLIVDLDRWVLAEAGRCLLSWSDDPDLGSLPVAVNISGRHLLSGLLPRHIGDVLEATGIDPGRLVIEITETVLLDDLDAAAAQLDAVRCLGVRVAIDDFGTGYTSLAHLQHLPVDIIKIDRSFITQLDRRRGSSLVRMVTDLGHAINLEVIAEGVETDAELTVLQSIGVDQLQGYLMSRPIEAVALKEWVHQRSHTRDLCLSGTEGSEREVDLVTAVAPGVRPAGRTMNHA
ncbi:MAG: hypothetical protein QOG64_876, partial [Acidimicrobiaceae bacterium]|nr:hypothetical protein [Acidimicrobiaceae bacterium]